MTIDDLAVARYGTSPTEEQTAETRKDVGQLTALTLTTTVNDGLVMVHAWVAQALLSHQGAQLAERHNRAFDLRWHRLTSGPWRFDDLTDACLALAANGRYDDLVQVARSGADAAIGELAAAAPRPDRPSHPDDRPRLPRRRSISHGRLRNLTGVRETSGCDHPPPGRSQAKHHDSSD
ncbi:hypothetical protein AB0J82_35500 [Asanoa sp. NPDC049518]|uniref:hypothetical protein n=1 Tax=unclassified Asanoa TaxID=2685164 RepID=UPI003432E617